MERYVPRRQAAIHRHLQLGICWTSKGMCRPVSISICRQGVCYYLCWSWVSLILGGALSFENLRCWPIKLEATQVSTHNAVIREALDVKIIWVMAIHHFVCWNTSALISEHEERCTFFHHKLNRVDCTCGVGTKPQQLSARLGFRSLHQ